MEIRSLSLKHDQAVIAAFYAHAGIRLDRGVTALFGAYEGETLLALGGIFGLGLGGVEQTQLLGRLGDQHGLVFHLDQHPLELATAARAPTTVKATGVVALGCVIGETFEFGHGAAR